MYNKTIMEHFHNPRNQQEMKNADSSGMGASPTCGDFMTIYLKVSGHTIEKASYTTMGCGAAIAAGSILTELLKGKTLEQAKQISSSTLIEALGGLPAIKMHCPELAIEALTSAIQKIEGNNSKTTE